MINSQTYDPSSARDLLILVPSDLPWTLDAEAIATAIAHIRSRLDAECEYIRVDGAIEDRLLAFFRTVSERHIARVVIVPLGLSAIRLEHVRSAWWFSALPTSIPCYMAEPLSHQDLGQWIADASFPLTVRECIEAHGANVVLSLKEDAPSSLIEAAVLTAFWASRRSPHSVSVVLGSVRDPDSTEDSRVFADIPWRSVIAQNGSTANRSLSTIQTEEGEFPWSWLRASSLTTWAIQRYLTALRSRPIPWFESSDPFEESFIAQQWMELNRLTHALDDDLPSEYSGNLDAVSPRSMGSAKLRYDENGLIPWDEIWTSFCDLAMAGGPPHRGKLLEPVSLESIEADRIQYEAVVRELRRGIALASGLATTDSPYAGWVAVICDDERMAAWMMRAILVENVIVRREANILYLPAGPAFRVEKEIKNVITSIAKTVHYWRAHLRSR
jgi:hypothetical protein